MKNRINKYLHGKDESWFDTNPVGSNRGPNLDINRLNDMYGGSNLNYGNGNQDNTWNGGKYMCMD